MRDFDDNEFPLAYLITFRCYGTWLHGDERRSYRRSHGLISGVSRIPARPRLGKAETMQLKHPPLTLNSTQRAVVEMAVREVRLHRKYRLRAINVRTNHVHTVVSALREPEPILELSNLTRRGHCDGRGFCLLVLSLGAAWKYDLTCGKSEMWRRQLSMCC
jgi:hypothetical protein